MGKIRVKIMKVGKIHVETADLWFICQNCVDIRFSARVLSTFWNNILN